MWSLITREEMWRRRLWYENERLFVASWPSLCCAVCQCQMAAAASSRSKSLQLRRTRFDERWDETVPEAKRREDRFRCRREMKMGTSLRTKEERNWCQRRPIDESVWGERSELPRACWHADKKWATYCRWLDFGGIDATHRKKKERKRKGRKRKKSHWWWLELSDEAAVTKQAPSWGSRKKRKECSTPTFGIGFFDTVVDRDTMTWYSRAVPPLTRSVTRKRESEEERTLLLRLFLNYFLGTDLRLNRTVSISIIRYKVLS